MDSIVPPHSHAFTTKTNEKDYQSVSETLSKIKQTISLLPREKGLSAFELYQYQGFWISSAFLECVMVAQEKFHAKPTDIYICSTPKSGTTWLKALCFAIYTRAEYDDSSNPLLTKNPHDCMPMIETEVAQILSRREETGGSSLPFISTHTPFTSLPKSIIHEGCKIIYICRDPKDTFISLWHFDNKIRKIRGTELMPIKEAFDAFSKGLSVYGPIWDHILGYWNASLVSPDNVLFLKYEDMIRDTSFYIKKLANFMNCPFSNEEEMEGMMEKIVCMCSFGNLSNLEVNKNGKGVFPKMGVAIDHSAYFRKGKIGDWKNYLTKEDATYLDAITEKKFQGSGLILHQSK